MCFYYNTNNTNTNLSSHILTKKSSEKRPLNLERRSKIMCFFVHWTTTYSEHAVEALFPSSQTSTEYSCLIWDGHPNYHSLLFNHFTYYSYQICSQIRVQYIQNRDCMNFSRASQEPLEKTQKNRSSSFDFPKMSNILDYFFGTTRYSRAILC